MMMVMMMTVTLMITMKPAFNNEASHHGPGTVLGTLLWIILFALHGN